MQQLGNAVYPQVVALVGAGLAGKVTGMLLQMPATQLLSLLDAPDAFRAAVDRAVGVLPAEMLEQLKLAQPKAEQPRGSLAPSGAVPSAPPPPPLAAAPFAAIPTKLDASAAAHGPGEPLADAAVVSIRPTAEEVRASSRWNPALRQDVTWSSGGVVGALVVGAVLRHMPRGRGGAPRALRAARGLRPLLL